MSSIEQALPQEQAPTNVAEFKDRLSRADGTLIPLGRQTDSGAQLFISSRYIANPHQVESPNAEADFYGWQEDKTLGPMSGVMAVDVLAEEDGEVVPVGHMDWWLQGDYANGGGNMHAAMVPRNNIEQRVLDRWGGRHNEAGDNIAFKLAPEYQKQKIGSLMLASSATALSALGVKEFLSGALLDPAVSTYAHFDVSPDDFRAARRGRDFDESLPGWRKAQLPLQRLADHPYVNEVMEHFLTSEPVAQAA